MKLNKKHIIFGALGVAIIGVATYMATQYKLLKNACYVVAGAIVNKLSLSQVKFTLLLNVKNNSDIDFTITNQQYDVYVNEMLVSKVDNPENTEIFSNGSTTFKINVDFNPQDLLKVGLENIEKLLLDKDKLVIEIVGKLSLRSGIVILNNYPIEERLTFKELLTKDSQTEVCH